MQKFLIRLFLYSLPAIVYVLAGETLLYKYKETAPLSAVVQQQYNSNKETYFTRSYFNTPASLYKRKMIEKRNPDILVLGVSVSLQLRSFLFHPYEKQFYNGGFLINNSDDLNSYLMLLRSGAIHKPKLIIFTLDPSWIKENGLYDNRNSILDPIPDEVTHVNLHVKAIQDIIHRVVQGGPVNSRFLHQGFGLPGTQGTGYRRDGSRQDRFQIDTYLRNHHYHDLYDYKTNLKNSTFIYTPPMRVNSKKVASLMKGLNGLRDMGIELIIYFTPLSDDFYNYAIKNHNFQNIFPHLLQLQNQLIQQRYHVIQFTTPKRMGLTDDYMLDGIHAGEVLASRQLYSYLSQHTELLQVLPQLDLIYVKQTLDKNPVCPLSFFDN
jgi:hypothetical protein